MSNKNSYVDRRIKKTKNALKKALLSLMEQKDFEEITIKHIAESADINRGTFYKHYQYKEDLLNEIIHDITRELDETLPNNIHPKTPEQRLQLGKTFSYNLCNHVYNNSTFYTLMIISNIISDFQNKFCETLNRLFLTSTMNYSSNLKVKAELLSAYSTHAIFGIVIEWIKGGFTYSPKYMSEQMVEILLLYKDN